jgi:hypothetical protein
VSKLPTVEIESGSSEKMWATPQTMDGLRINQVRKKEELSDKAKKGGCSNLREQVMEEPQMWMTPSATNISKRSEEGMEKREKMRNDRGRKTIPPGSLAEQVDYGYPIKDMKEAEMWPTPAARDYKDTGENTDYEKLAKKSKLSGAVKSKMFLTPGANEDAAGKPTGKMQRMLGNSPEVRNTGRGTLNPDWVEWLMGYPPGWTDITDLK